MIYHANIDFIGTHSCFHVHARRGSECVWRDREFAFACLQTRMGKNRWTDQSTVSGNGHITGLLNFDYVTSFYLFVLFVYCYFSLFLPSF